MNIEAMQLYRSYRQAGIARERARYLTVTAARERAS